jgi:linoleoyl-CoA desaturase
MIDLSSLEYAGHPGGQQQLHLAKGHTRADLLYLSNHLGRDHGAIEAIARARGVDLPAGLRTPDYDGLNQIVADIRRRHGGHLLLYRGYCVLVTLALPIAYLFYLLSLSPLSLLLLGFLFVTYAFNLFHMRHHMGGRLYASGMAPSGLPAWLDSVSGPLYDVIDEVFMVTPAAWIQQHQGAHHIHTNHVGLDYDVSKPYPLLRLHPDQPWRAWHAWQPLYVPIALFLNGLTFAADNVLNKGGRRVFLLAHYLLLIGLPAWFHGVFAALAAYLLMLGTASLLSGYLFQVSHNASGVMRTDWTRGESTPSYDQWLQWQIEESLSHGGYLMTWLFGGINLQTEHHAAPALEPVLLHFLQPELQRFAAQRGIGYRHLPNLFAAIAEYHRRLAQLAIRPDADSTHGASTNGLK